MSFGKLYTNPDNPRSTAIKAVAKANNIDLEDVQVNLSEPTAEHLRAQPLGKIPAFEGKDGYILSECIAIAVYITSQNEKTSLLGKTKQDYASILRWMSFANSEVLPALGGWYMPVLGRAQYNKKNVDDSIAKARKSLKVLDSHLLVNTFLVGERITLADLFTAGLVSRGYQYLFGKDYREEYPSLTRWFDTIYNQPIYSEVANKFSYLDETAKNVAPASTKKEKEPKKEAPKKEAPKPKAVENDDDGEDEAPSEPKQKHPLEALPKPTLVLDDWKRKYSNEETREVALPWFWENYKPEEYSLWRMDYKYNDELTMTFMTSNLIGGFFTRLEASRKYIFGAASVYGVTNDSVVRGAFVIRGQDAAPAFDVAPDFESYEFIKLDHTKPEDKEFVDDMWAWDKPIEVNGKPYEWADGKVFK